MLIKKKVLNRLLLAYFARVPSWRIFIRRVFRWSRRCPGQAPAVLVQDSVRRAERGGGRVHGLAVAAAGAGPGGMGAKAVPTRSAEVFRFVFHIQGKNSTRL